MGDQVFPIPFEPAMNEKFMRTTSTPGLTKRELFAALFLQGILREGGLSTDKEQRQFYCQQGVAYADALIEELGKDG